MHLSITTWNNLRVSLKCLTINPIWLPKLVLHHFCIFTFLTFATSGKVWIRRSKGINVDFLLHFGNASFHLPGGKQFKRHLSPCLPTYLPTFLPTYLPTNLPTYLSTDLPTYRPTYLTTDRPTDRSRPTDRPTYLPTYPVPTYHVDASVASLFYNCLLFINWYQSICKKVLKLD